MTFKRDSIVFQKHIPEKKYLYKGIVPDTFSLDTPVIVYDTEKDKYVVIPDSELEEEINGK